MDGHTRYILFDLDGTLIPLSRQVFEPALFASFDALFREKFPDDPRTAGAFRRAMAACEGEAGSPETNEQRMTRLLRREAGDRAEEILWALEEHYAGAYNDIRRLITGPCCADAALSLAERYGAAPVLATNPVSPRSCIAARLGWIGLTPERFRLVTTWDICRYTKPDPRYYRELLSMLDAAPEDCLMIGNDTEDDMEGAERAGIGGYLVTDHLMDRHGTAERYRRGSFVDMLVFLNDYLKEGGRRKWPEES